MESIPTERPHGSPGMPGDALGLDAVRALYRRRARSYDWTANLYYLTLVIVAAWEVDAASDTPAAAAARLSEAARATLPQPAL